MEERAAACLARFTNARVRLILDVWREVASVQKYQRYASKANLLMRLNCYTASIKQ